MNLLNIATSPLKSLCSKGYAVGSNVCWPKPSYGPHEVFRSEFLNGIRVAGRKPLEGSVAACTLMYQVGSRFESDEDLGVSHFIRNGSALSGIAAQGFLRCRQMEHHGAYLTCSGDRQYTAFTLRCPAPVFPMFYCDLLDCAIRNEYPDWELEEVKKTVRADLKRRHPVEHVIDLIQTATFTGPLSNSIYCVKERINGITSKTIRDFIKKYYKTNLCTIGSDGAPYEEVIQVASNLECGRVNYPATWCPPRALARGGYEYYDKGPGDYTYIAIGVPGTGSTNFKCCLTHAILAAACGLGNMQQGQHTLNRMLHTPLKALSEENDARTDMCAFNISHAETGVFGILVKSRSKMIRCSVFRAAEFLYNLNNITPEQIAIGKKRLEVEVMLANESCVETSINLALQCAYKVNVDNTDDLRKMINCIPCEAVMDVAYKIACKQCYYMSLAVVGDVAATPDDGELRPQARRTEAHVD